MSPEYEAYMQSEEWEELKCSHPDRRECVAWAIDINRTVMIIRAQRREEEYQPIGVMLAGAR